jgi:glycosyltransferase involved in cell wall biosynthesis
MGALEEMPICLILRRFTIGGLERVLSLLANGLVARGRKVRVVALGHGSPNGMITELDPRVDLHILSGPWSARLRRLGELTRDHLVHLHFADGLIHPRVRWKLRGHRPVVVTYHSVYTPHRNRFTNRLDRIITGRSQAVIACSQAVGDFCVGEVGLPHSLVSVICNAVPAPALGAIRWESQAGFYLISLASVNPHKDHVTLIRGLALLRGRGHDIRLRIVGDGPATAAAFQVAGQLGMSHFVEWYGAVWKPEIVNALLQDSDLFVSASTNEGFPLSVLEGLHSGLAMVLSDIAPHREVAGDGSVYFAPGDPAQFADLVELLLDDQVRKRHAFQAAERASCYAIDDFVDRHLAVYQKVCRQGE